MEEAEVGAKYRVVEDGRGRGGGERWGSGGGKR